MKPTKGPWEVFTTPSGYRLVEYHDKSKGPDGRESVCRVVCNEENELANAQLIAAAPEMFALLERFVRAPGYDLKNIWEQAYAIVNRLKSEVVNEISDD